MAKSSEVRPASTGAGDPVKMPDIMVPSQLVASCPEFFVSERAVRMRVARRQIPFRKVKGRLVFLRREIERWIETAPGLRPDDIE